MESVKQVRHVHQSGSTHWVGDGFHVRNLFPSNDLGQQISPFLLLDYAGPTDFSPTDRPRGVGEHPHRGFETVSIVYQGELAHRDSAGNHGTLGPGDVQWMTAASGVVHEEMQERGFAKRGGTVEMVQLWVNLPRAFKMSPPRYQTLLKEQIPVVDLPKQGGSVRVIAGEFHGIKGPAKTFIPINLYDLRLKAGHQAATYPAWRIQHWDLPAEREHCLEWRAFRKRSGAGLVCRSGRADFNRSQRRRDFIGTQW